MMTRLTIAGGTGRTILVSLGLLFSNEQDLLLRCVLLGHRRTVLPFLPRGTKPQAWGTDPTSRMANVAPCSGGCCLRNPVRPHRRCFLAACRPLAQFCPNCVCQPWFPGWYLGPGKGLLPATTQFAWTRSLPSFSGKGLQNTLAVGHREAQRPKKLCFSLITVFPGLLHAPGGLWGCIWGCGVGKFSGVAIAVLWLNKSAPVCMILAPCPLRVPARGPAAHVPHSRFLLVRRWCDLSVPRLPYHSECFSTSWGFVW